MNSDWIKSLDENDTWEMRLIVIIAIFTFILLHLNVFFFLIRATLCIAQL